MRGRLGNRKSRRARECVNRCRPCRESLWSGACNGSGGDFANIIWSATTCGKPATLLCTGTGPDGLRSLARRIWRSAMCSSSKHCSGWRATFRCEQPCLTTGRGKGSLQRMRKRRGPDTQWSGGVAPGPRSSMCCLASTPASQGGTSRSVIVWSTICGAMRRVTELRIEPGKYGKILRKQTWAAGVGAGIRWRFRRETVVR